jgi:hypothetical protein
MAIKFLRTTDPNLPGVDIFYSTYVGTQGLTEAEAISVLQWCKANLSKPAKWGSDWEREFIQKLALAANGKAVHASAPGNVLHRLTLHLWLPEDQLKFKFQYP